jgi:hypothetical protein
MGELVHITADEAIAALTVAATEVTDETSSDYGRTLIHSMAGPFGADWDLASAITAAQHARDIAWMDDSYGHELAVLTQDGRVRKFNAQRPTREADTR